MKPSVMRQIAETVQTLPPGQLFGYEDLGILPIQFAAAAAALSRLAKEGVIIRYARGRYYRPVAGRFGTLQPTESAVIASLSTQKGTAQAYPTGPTLYNKMGLTTQVPNRVTLAAPRPLRHLPRHLRAVVRPAPETSDDIPLLQWMEVLRDVGRIPDSSPDRVVTQVQQALAELTAVQLVRLAELACRQAPPRVRALLGAILELSQADRTLTDPLRQSLNPLTRYRLGISEQTLPNRVAWNIQ